jgi:hypothetical protein
VHLSFSDKSGENWIDDLMFLSALLGEIQTIGQSIPGSFVGG